MRLIKNILQITIVALMSRSTYIKSMKNSDLIFLNDALSLIKCLWSFRVERIFLSICFEFFYYIAKLFVPWYLEAEYSQFRSRWSLDINTLWSSIFNQKNWSNLNLNYHYGERVSVLVKIINISIEDFLNRARKISSWSVRFFLYLGNLQLVFWSELFSSFEEKIR